MSHNFRSFVTPGEFESVVDAIAKKTGAGLWVFPEAARTGEIERVESLDEGQRRLKWFGLLPPGCTVWNSYDAATEAGFVCLVRPEVDSSATTVYMGEVFTPASDLSGASSLFMPVKRALTKMLPRGTVAISDRDPEAPGVKGPKCSEEVFALYESGYVLRQRGVGLVHYVPSSSTR